MFNYTEQKTRSQLRHRVRNINYFLLKEESQSHYFHAAQIKK